MTTTLDSGSPLGTYRTTDERAQIGRAARERVPRKSQGRWAPAVDRPDPVTLLVEQESTRVPGLLPLRHERMGASALAFYRGTAVIMANDLGADPNSGLQVQLCGDAHLSNFGLFAAPDRVPIFDVNDFDETQPGPFEWDVKRLCASFVLAAMRAHDRAVSSGRVPPTWLPHQTQATAWVAISEGMYGEILGGEDG